MYKVEFLGKSNCGESLEGEDSEQEDEVIDSKAITLDQASDDDEVVDSVINRLSGFTHSTKNPNFRYEMDHSFKDFEFTNENVFCKKSDKSGRDSKDSTMKKVEVAIHREGGIDLPLQIIRTGENRSQNISLNSQEIKEKKEIELAVCLYDFEPQKKTDLGFKAGERILIESRNDSANWWFGSIGTRKGWFPRNYIKIKKVAKD
jgi:hypothetical protein